MSDTAEKKYKHIEIDPETCTKEELEKEIARLKDKSDFYDSKQLAQKLFLNSCYGAVANNWFFGYNRDIAEAITLQGQDLNHFSENVVNRYITQYFKTDTALHEKLGVRTEDVQKVTFQAGRLTNPGPLDRKDPAYRHLEQDYSFTVAGDTDSIYVEFGRLANQLHIPKEKTAEFCVNFWNWGCGPFLEKAYAAYAKSFNCNENLEKLELEKIMSTMLATGKKHYTASKCFSEPNIFFPDPMEHVSVTGLEVVQSSCPKYVRKCLNEFYRFVLGSYEDNKKPVFSEIVTMLKRFKDGIVLAPLDHICKGSSVGDYNKFVLDDHNKVMIDLHCPIHVKGSAYYNHDLYSDKKRLLRYSKITSGSKVKFYYTKDPQRPVYAYPGNTFPGEFAPAIDYDEQFAKLILEPVNKILEILGYQRLPVNLCYTRSLLSF